jgi:hypothetical protein
MPKLSDLNIDEVSLVRKGANQHARVAIAKSAGGEVDEEYFDQEGNAVDVEELEHGDIVFDSDGEAYQYDEPGDDDDEVEKALYVGGREVTSRVGRAAGKAYIGAGRKAKSANKFRIQTGAIAGQAARRGAKRVSSAAGTGAGFVAGNAKRGAGAVAGAARSTGTAAGNAGNAMGGAIRGAAAQTEGFLRTENNAFNTRGRIGALGAGGVLAGAGGGYAAGSNGRVRKSASDDLREELSKALTDDDRDEVIAKAFGYVEQAEQVAQEAWEIAEEERENRRAAEFYEVAKSYDMVPVDTEDLAIAMMHMADLLPEEDVQVIAKALGFAADVADELYEEQGNVGGGDNSDVMEQLQTFARNRVAKSGEGSAEQYLVDALNHDPAVYDQYLADNSR